MNQRKFLISIFIGIFLIAGTAGILSAQTNSYHVSINGTATGPYDMAALRQLVSQGQLTRNSLVWREGMANWVVAGAVEELAPLFAQAAPPPVPAAPAAPPPPPAPAGPPALPGVQTAQYTSFTNGQRWGTFWLNAVVPGLGSFVIMRDTAGGVTNLLLGLSGYTSFIIYNATSGIDTWRTSSGLITYNYYNRPAWLWIGWGLYTAGFIQNIVRSSTYNRPQPSLALSENDSWDLAVIPGRSGVEALSFSYTLRY